MVRRAIVLFVKQNSIIICPFKLRQNQKQTYNSDNFERLENNPGGSFSISFSCRYLKLASMLLTYCVYLHENFCLFNVRFFEKIQDCIFKSENKFCVSLLNRSVQDLSNHGASKEPKNPLWARILRVFLIHQDASDLGLICLS